MDVACDGQEVDFVFDQFGLETALEEMAGTAVFVARIKRVGRQQSLHETRKIGSRCSTKQVEMVLHEHEGIQIDSTQMQMVRQLREEPLAVAVAVKNLRPAVAAAGNVIHGAGKINPWWTWHA